MKRRFLSFAFVLSFVLALLAGCSPQGDPASDFDAETKGDVSTSPQENPASDFEYKYNAELKGIEITKYIGNSVKVRIPSKIEGEPVKAIGKEAFSGSGIMSVEIPDSVTEIGEGAFCFCKGLTNVTIPDSVTKIGYLVFNGCAEQIIVTYKGITYGITVRIDTQTGLEAIIDGLSGALYNAVNGK